MKDLILPFGAQITQNIWGQVLNRSCRLGLSPGLFLDRDGVIVKEVNYLSKDKDVTLISGAAEVILKANSNQLPVVLVTNQSGIGLGKFDWDDFSLVQKKIVEELDLLGCFINGVLACPFHPNGLTPFNSSDHPFRKPNPGMLLEAQKIMSIDLKKSWIIGDRARDLEAGKNAGLFFGVHVLTGHGINERDSSLALGCDSFKVKGVESIADLLDSKYNYLFEL